MRRLWSIGGTGIALAALVAIPASFIAAPPACADSWAMPTRQQFESANGHYRLTIEPSEIGSQLDYFESKLQEADRGTVPVDQPHALGVLERRNATGAWEPVWAMPLVNEVAPVSALVSDNGTRVVTFDNWHSVGYGPNAIVIYDERGNTIRAMALTELVGGEYFSAFPRSVSSMRWKTGSRVSDDGSTLILDLIIPSTDGDNDDTVAREICLSDGSIVAADALAWNKALASARTVIANRAANERAQVEYMSSPLRVPNDTEMSDWHAYLREAFTRLTPGYLNDDFTGTTVLFSPDNPRYQESVGWLRDEFAEAADFAANISVASPKSQQGLIDALRMATKDIRPNSLSGTAVYVSVDGAHREQAEQLVKRTGAQFVWLDPEASIPQRPERMPDSAEKAAADAERQRRQMADMQEMLNGLDP